MAKELSTLEIAQALTVQTRTELFAKREALKARLVGLGEAIRDNNAKIKSFKNKVNELIHDFVASEIGGLQSVENIIHWLAEYTGETVHMIFDYEPAGEEKDECVRLNRITFSIRRQVEDSPTPKVVTVGHITKPKLLYYTGNTDIKDAKQAIKALNEAIEGIEENIEAKKEELADVIKRINSFETTVNLSVHQINKVFLEQGVGEEQLEILKAAVKNNGELLP